MADYSITAVTRRKVFSGSAGVGPYAFTFPILTQTDIVVYKNSTKLVLTTDYTVTINGTNGTGSVTLVSAATASDTITIIGARAIQRTTDFVTAGDLAASSLNEQLDGLTIMVQQLAEENKRTVKAPPYDPEAVDDGGILNMQLPAKADRAGKVMAFDTNGNPSAGSVSLPSSLTATYYPRVNTGGTAYELRAPASVRADIGADNASNLTSGTVSDSRLPGTIDGKTLTNVSITSGSITGITDLAVADGGTGSSTAAGARSNLGAAASGTNADITSMTAITGGVSSPDFIQFDTGAGATTAVGKLFWNNTNGTLDVGLKGGNVTIPIGQENVLIVRNDEATTLSVGEVVYISGANGTNILVKRADASTEAASANVIGVVAESITSGSDGFITTFGIVVGVNTAAFNAGDALYLSTTAGALTKTKPTAPDNLVLVGYCVKSSAGSGEVFVEPQNGYELDELHNVYINSVANNDVLVYDSTDGRWENKAQSTLTAGSVNGSATITSGTISGITALSVAGTSSTTGEIKLYEDTDNGTNYVGWKAPASISADISWTLPAADGTSGQLLSTNGSGTLSWTTPAGGGDVSGPASSTDNAIVRFDLTSGKSIQNSVATLSDTGVLTTAEVSTDTISEKTAAAGVTIDGVLLKDSAVTTDTINEKTAAAGVTIDGVLLKDAAVNTDTINEKTSAAGVTVDGVLLKDAAVSTDTINEKTSAAGVTIDGVVLKDGGATLTSPIILADGTASAPSVTNTGDTNTGIYFSGDNAIGFATDGTQRGEFDASGNFKFNSGYGSVVTAYGCRAWVNFDGTQTAANMIRASGNVSSMTDNGTGDYTVNFTTAMPDANYCAQVSQGQGAGAGVGMSVITGAAPSTSAVRIQTANSAGTLADRSYVMVAIFR